MKCGFFQAQKLPPAPRLLANSALFYTVLSGLAEACGMQMGKGYEGIYAFFFLLNVCTDVFILHHL